MPTENRPTVKLVGCDGNALSMLGRCHKVIKRDWPQERWKAFCAEATNGDYDHVLQTIMEHFEVE